MSQSYFRQIQLASILCLLISPSVSQGADQSWSGLKANKNNSSYVQSEITATAIRERGFRVLWKHDQRTVVKAHPSFELFPGLFEAKCENPSNSATLECLRKTAVDIPPAVYAGDPGVVYVTSYKWVEPLLRDQSPLDPSNAVTPFGTLGKNSGHGELTALDADSGAVLWQHKLSDYSDISGCNVDDGADEEPHPG